MEAEQEKITIRDIIDLGKMPWKFFDALNDTGRSVDALSGAVEHILDWLQKNDPHAD